MVKVSLDSSIKYKKREVITQKVVLSLSDY